MKTKLLFKLALFLIPLLVFAFFLNYIIDNGLRESNYKNYKEWNAIYKGNINADVLVIGSSRAVHHFSTYILDSALALNSFNLGMSGQWFLMQKSRFKVYEKYNRKPNYIILSLDFNFYNPSFQTNSIEEYLPYLNDTLLSDALKKINKVGLMELYCPLYKYNGQRRILNVGFAEYFGFKQYENKKYKGYESNANTWGGLGGLTQRIANEYPKGYKEEVNSENVKLLEEFILYCKENDIELYLVYSPEHSSVNNYCLNKREILDFTRKLTDKHQIVFLDYSQDSISYDKRYFYDALHLNKYGSEVFTRKLASDLKIYINRQVEI